MTPSRQREYAAALIAQNKCVQCRGPQDADRKGKRCCRACTDRNSSARAEKFKELIAAGTCTWCLDPVEADRKGKRLCRICSRTTTAKRYTDREPRAYSCSFCSKPGHGIGTCEERAKQVAA